jgi:hypothetical protein
VEGDEQRMNDESSSATRLMKLIHLAERIATNEGVTIDELLKSARFSREASATGDKGGKTK